MVQRYKKYLTCANFWAIKCSKNYFFFCKQINISKIVCPFIVSGTTIIYCLYFYSFSIHFHDHLATILNVSVGFLFLLYLFLFFASKGNNPHV